MFDQGIDETGKDLGVDTMAVARYDVGKVFKKAWDKEQQPDQWARLAEIIAAKNPQKIGLNFSNYFGQADGLTMSEHKQFINSLKR